MQAKKIKRGDRIVGYGTVDKPTKYGMNVKFTFQESDATLIVSPLKHLEVVRDPATS